MNLKPKTYHLKAISGFTLIELLVVIAIISLLSSIVLASLQGARVKARDSKRVQDLLQIRNALELYYAKYGKYPNHVSGSFVRIDCWQCSTDLASLSPYSTYYDGNNLSVLGDENLLEPRPSDPSRPDDTRFPTSPPSGEGYSGYWYKVSPNQRDYKVVLTRPASEIGIPNFPDSMIDRWFWPNGETSSVSISVYSSDISKVWRFDD